MEKFTTTTKDIGLLLQLHQDGQLLLTPEFQRNSVWPRAARAFLIDTILNGFPIPVLYFQRQVSAQTNRVQYAVIDGQQRLSSIFSFIDNRYSLVESEPESPWHRRRWADLEPEHREAILAYDFTIQEISGFKFDQIREMFRRMNRYVVALNPQELRHSSPSGEFKALVERIGAWGFWREVGAVTSQGVSRMKNDELAAELLILLYEGPQDKKESVDLYYSAYQQEFPPGVELENRLERILAILGSALPRSTGSRLNKPAAIYALVGAIDEIIQDGPEGGLPSVEAIRTRLEAFDMDLREPVETRSGRAAEYLLAQSRQTDNIRPRETRIEILKQIILGA